MPQLFHSLVKAVSEPFRCLAPEISVFQQTSPSIEKVTPARTLSISLTDHECQQKCAHCNGHYLKGMHINDSKKELASRVDRHDSIGKGVMNMDLFSFIMNDPRFENMPLILETPDELLWAEEIATLYSLISQ